MHISFARAVAGPQVGVGVGTHYFVRYDTLEAFGVAGIAVIVGLGGTSA